MPRIRILQSVAGVDVSYAPGEEIDAGAAMATSWVAAGLAEPVTEKAVTEKASPRSRGGGRGPRAETRST